MKKNETLDLRGLACPDNLPKLLLKLETMNKGEILELIVDDFVALDRIPLALAEEDDYLLMNFNTKNNSNIHIYIKIK
jgi:TusA-related sulfurtransferase